MSQPIPLKSLLKHHFIVGVCLAISLIMALGIWYMTRLYYIEREKRELEEIKKEEINREKAAIYERMKASSQSYNEAIATKDPESCKAILDQSTKEDCQDAYTLQEAHQAPEDSTAICRQMKKAFRIESCISSVEYQKIQKQKSSTPTPYTITGLKIKRSKCETITDKLYRSSCESDSERIYIQTAHARGSLTVADCNEVHDDAIKNYCLRLTQ